MVELQEGSESASFPVRKLNPKFNIPQMVVRGCHEAEWRRTHMAESDGDIHETCQRTTGILQRIAGPVE